MRTAFSLNNVVLNQANECMNRTLAVTALILLSLLTFSADANELPSSVKELRMELDTINFDLKGKEKLTYLEALIEHTEKLAKENANDAGFQMMAGFFNAQYAGAKGGMGALKYAKAARDYLEYSLELNPETHRASAYSVLGTLYLRVPGWPVGYGNKKKAVAHYKKALEISPEGIDPNFTYAEYLYSKKKYAEAKTYLLKAKSAAPRPLRPRADEELHKAIDRVLTDIEKKLNK